MSVFADFSCDNGKSINVAGWGVGGSGEGGVKEGRKGGEGRSKWRPKGKLAMWVNE